MDVIGQVGAILITVTFAVLTVLWFFSRHLPWNQHREEFNHHDHLEPHDGDEIQDAINRWDRIQTMHGRSEYWD
jgi:hypothetical protein